MYIRSKRKSKGILYKKRKDAAAELRREFAKKINRSTREHKLAHVPFMPM